MSKRRVVVTGLGVVSPVGIGVNTAWENLVAGQSGITRITKFDPTPFSSHMAGEVKDFDVSLYLPAKEARRMDTFIQFGMAAGIEAFKDSGLEVTEENAERIGVAIGSGIGGLNLIEQTNDTYDEGGPRKISPFFIPGTIINMISGNLSIMFGLKGPNVAIVTACTTGTHCIGDAARMIEYGDADVMVAGGAEAAITELSVGGFASARALSNRNDDPATASRPWDKDRDGFVIGEGAGVMVLEEYEHAKARGAKIYAELSGYGMSADAYHMTAPNMDGPRRSMNNALKNAGIAADKVEQLFEAFTQVDSSTTRRYGGTGLWLTISRRLAELRGGTIGVVSVEGGGSTFWFTVVLEKLTESEALLHFSESSPLEAMGPKDEDIPRLSEVGGARGEGVVAIRILLTEDDPNAQKIVPKLLTSHGYLVDVAGNGKEALQALEKNDYALVLMDCMMPELSGYEVTTVIRDPASSVRRHDIPIIALTGNAMKQDRDRCIAAGMDDHLPKPLLLPDLLAKLEKWLC